MKMSKDFFFFFELRRRILAENISFKLDMLLIDILGA